MNKVKIVTFALIISMCTSQPLQGQTSNGSPVIKANELLNALGFTCECSVSSPSQELIPVDFIKANPPWGVQQYVCKNGGYSLEKYSGKPYSTLSCKVKAWLDAGQGKRCGLRASGFVVNGEIACLYLVADAECGLVPGLMAINAAKIIKE